MVRGILGNAGLVAFFAIFILFFAGSVSALETIYTDWHYSGDTFTVSGDVYLVSHYDFYSDRVVLTVNNVDYLIKEGECKETPTRKYCIIDINNNISATSNIKFENGNPYAGIFIEISKKGPDITITRDFSTTSPELYETVKVSIAFENEGDEYSDTFRYQETLPSGVQVLSASSGVIKQTNSIAYEKNIAPGEKVNINYDFKMNEYMNFTSKGLANYTYQGEKFAASTSAVTVSIPKPYSFSASFADSSVEASTESELNIEIASETDTDITIKSVNVAVPGYFSFTPAADGLKKSGSIYAWAGTLKKDGSKALDATFTPLRSGKYYFIISMEAVDSDGKVFQETKNLSFESTMKSAEPIFSLSEASLSSGAEYRIAFSLRNPNLKVLFSSINAVIRSDLFSDMPVNLSELGPGKTATLLVNDTLMAPYLDAKKTFKIYINGTYETSTHEKGSFSKDESLTVTPVNETITIIQKPENRTIVAGNNMTMTVEIKNNNEEPLEVAVSDSLDIEAIIGGGKNSAMLSLAGKETKKAFDYNILIPLDYPEKNLTITTTAIVKSKAYTSQKTVSAKILRPAIADNALKNDTANKTKPVAATTEPPKKEGFFKKIINGISGFFKRLFS